MTPALWSWPQWVMIGLWGLMLAINMAKDGERKGTRWSTSNVLVDIGVSTFLLWQGGFFK